MKKDTLFSAVKNEPLDRGPYPFSAQTKERDLGSED